MDFVIARPGVLEAAVIAIPHPTWQERPLACVVANADEIPKTSVGKFAKKVLRDRYRSYLPAG